MRRRRSVSLRRSEIGLRHTSPHNSVVNYASTIFSFSSSSLSHRRGALLVRRAMNGMVEGCKKRGWGNTRDGAMLAMGSMGGGRDAKKWFDENHGDGSSVFVARSQEYAVRA